MFRTQPPPSICHPRPRPVTAKPTTHPARMLPFRPSRRPLNLRPRNLDLPPMRMLLMQRLPQLPLGSPPELRAIQRLRFPHPQKAKMMRRNRPVPTLPFRPFQSLPKLRPLMRMLLIQRLSRLPLGSPPELAISNNCGLRWHPQNLEM